MTPSAALRVIREAFNNGRAYLLEHARARMLQRGVSFDDIEHAVLRARFIEAYPGPRDDGESCTSWRITGPGLDRAAVSVGVQLSLDERGNAVVVVTVF